jgi:8-oxo-dGTP pyrophosphatase MutT (NUDIX family)
LLSPGKQQPLAIYLEDKVILLAAENEQEKGDWIAEYYSREQIHAIYHEFAAGPAPKRLVFLSSENNHARLREDFFSLFRCVEAAGGVVKNEKNQRLFIFRRGKWDLPKGKIFGKKNKKNNSGRVETPEETALREVMEETGIHRLAITGKLPDTYHIYYTKGQPVLKCTHWFSMISASAEKLIPETRENITAVKWIGENELGKVLGNTYSSLRDLIRITG